MTENRTKIFQDTLTNIIPERVPIDVPLSFEAVLNYGGVNVAEAQWNPSLIQPVVREVCERLHSDKSPFTRPSRTASMYKFMGSKSFVFSANDIMQHPEVQSLYPEDYDYLIEHPYDCILERALPRFNDNIDFINNPVASMLTFAKAHNGQIVDANEYASATSKIISEYDYYPGFKGGASVAPLDFLADILRSFTGVSTDIRRDKEKVKAAAESLFPLLYKAGMPSVINEYSRVSYWTHMPTFMRTKDFEEVWWPTFYKMAVNYASIGVGIFPWVEDDWTRYVDHLSELPINSMLRFEYGDKKLYKEKLGNKHILTGLYPFSALKTNSKDECIDIAKDLIDVMAPGGRFIFMFDKVLMDINREEMDKLCAVVDYVHEYAKYDNHGEKSGLDFKKEDYTALPAREFDSKYYTDWSKVPGISERCAKKMQLNEDALFQCVIQFFK